MPQGVPSGFYYIPVTPLEMTNHHWLQVSNMILITVFYPCHLLDKTVFGGPDYAFPPITGFTDARHETPK